MQGEAYRRNRNDWYMARHQQRRAEAAVSLDQLVWFNVTFLIANLARRKLTCDMPREELIQISTQPCYYCGDIWSGGIDRFDALVTYTRVNSVPCCKVCNKMKMGMHGDHFIAYCLKIHSGDTASQLTARAMANGDRHEKYHAAAVDRKRCFDLTRLETSILFSQPCTFCKLENCNGIDRINGSDGYTSSNVRPMCFVCNYTRGVHDDETFFRKVTAISTKHATHSMTFNGVSKFTSSVWKFSEGAPFHIRESNVASDDEDSAEMEREALIQ